jgi:hypothetical protein
MKREELISSGGAHCDGGFVFWFLGLVFAIIALICDAMNITLALESTSWLLLAVVFVLSGIASWMAWGLALHLDALETNNITSSDAQND